MDQEYEQPRGLDAWDLAQIWSGSTIIGGPSVSEMDRGIGEAPARRLGLGIGLAYAAAVSLYALG